MPQEITYDALDLTEFVQSGDTVTWGQACAEPVSLTTKLVAQRAAIGRFNVLVGLSLSDTLAPEHLDCISVYSYGALGSNNALATAGGLQVIPCNYSAIAQLITSRKFPVDVVLVQLSPRGPDGHYSLGLANDHLIPSMRAARVVIGEVNENIPCSSMDEPLDESLLDIIVPSSATPVYSVPATIGDTEKKIASQVLNVIEDGAVIQYGVGSVPAAILAALSSHRRLGIHSGMITDTLLPLLESGAITNETNRLNPGVTVGALAIGSELFARYLHLNKQVQVHPSTKTHSAAALSQLDRLVAINSAFEVDLFGQVNAEMVGDRYLGAVGGQVDFMHAASTHQDGLSIVAMPSVTHNGKHSRIVSRLTAPLVTTGKSDVDIIVTENGLADLRGKTLRQRAEAIAQIAAPQFQDDLQRQYQQEFRR